MLGKEKRNRDDFRIALEKHLFLQPPVDVLADSRGFIQFKRRRNSR